MRSFHVIERFAPSSFARVLDGRKVLFVAEGYCGATCSASNGIIPRRNVQHEIPYAMRIRDGMRGGSHGIHVFQKFQDRVTVPGFSLESTTYLIRKPGRFSYWYVHADGFTRVTTTEASWLSDNTTLGMQAYGIIDDNATLTSFDEQLYTLRGDPKSLYDLLAKHILPALHCSILLQCVQDIQAEDTPVRERFRLPGNLLRSPSTRIGSSAAFTRTACSRVGSSPNNMFVAN